MHGAGAGGRHRGGPGGLRAPRSRAGHAQRLAARSGSAGPCRCSRLGDPAPGARRLPVGGRVRSPSDDRRGHPGPALLVRGRLPGPGRRGAWEDLVGPGGGRGGKAARRGDGEASVRSGDPELPGRDGRHHDPAGAAGLHRRRRSLRAAGSGAGNRDLDLHPSPRLPHRPAAGHGAGRAARDRSRSGGAAHRGGGRRRRCASRRGRGPSRVHRSGGAGERAGETGPGDRPGGPLDGGQRRAGGDGDHRHRQRLRARPAGGRSRGRRGADRALRARRRSQRPGRGAGGRRPGHRRFRCAGEPGGAPPARRGPLRDRTLGRGGTDLLAARSPGALRAHRPGPVGRSRRASRARAAGGRGAAGRARGRASAPTGPSGRGERGRSVGRRGFGSGDSGVLGGCAVRHAPGDVGA